MKEFVSLLKKNRKAQALLFLIVALAFADGGFYFLRSGPAARKVQALEDKAFGLREDIEAKNREMAVHGSLDSGLKQLAQFDAMLPQRGEFIGIIKKVYRMAKDDGMKSSSFGTDVKETQEGDLLQVNFSMPISGKYKDVRKFIYDIESSPLFLNINALSLSSTGPEGDITLTIALSTYMRS